MDKILTVYNKLRELREQGVKMKDISTSNGITPSVLSSLYRTILPSYLEAINQGLPTDRALDDSLAQVNNLSRRKFFELIDSLAQSLEHSGVSLLSSSAEGDLIFDDLKKEALRHRGKTFNYCGFYLGYSRSSYKNALKIEPMLILPPDRGATMYRVACMNAQNQIYWGSGLFTDHQISYLFFNEQLNLQLGLKVVYMQLPMFDRPRMVKGIYLAHDYSRNPIARRVVYIKQDDISLEEFERLSVEVRESSELTAEELSYFRYTSQKGDYIHSLMSLSSPEADAQELEYEKRVLNLEF